MLASGAFWPSTRESDLQSDVKNGVSATWELPSWKSFNFEVKRCEEEENIIPFFRGHFRKLPRIETHHQQSGCLAQRMEEIHAKRHRTETTANHYVKTIFQSQKVTKTFKSCSTNVDADFMNHKWFLTDLWNSSMLSCKGLHLVNT